MTSNTKTILVVVVILLLGGVAYFGFAKGGDTATSSIETIGGETVSLGTGEVGADITALLNEINQLKIDNSLFQDPVYLYLVDYSQEIPPLPVGRENPFAPIPGQAAAAALKTTTPKDVKLPSLPKK